jgi:hypothetical protein
MNVIVTNILTSIFTISNTAGVKDIQMPKNNSPMLRKILFVFNLNILPHRDVVIIRAPNHIENGPLMK